MTRAEIASRAALGLLAAFCFGPALAQTTAQQQGAPQGSSWDALPRMQLERQFAGPLRDTVVQRWRDPVDGAVCYIYLPISAQHSPPAANGFVTYGANTVGSLSCFAGPTRSAAPVASPKQAPSKQP